MPRKKPVSVIMGRTMAAAFLYFLVMPTNAVFALHVEHQDPTQGRKEQVPRLA